ncbi:unnamed protein product, partial [Brassica oleracea]
MIIHIIPRSGTLVHSKLILCIIIFLFCLLLHMRPTYCAINSTHPLYFVCTTRR